MAKFKDFGASTDISSDEPVSFRLDGEEFNCRTRIPGKVMLDLAAKSGDQENPSEGAKVIDDFFKLVLIGESYERFNSLVTDPDRIISMEQLMDIVSWLTEMYTERPT